MQHSDILSYCCPLINRYWPLSIIANDFLTVTEHQHHQALAKLCEALGTPPADQENGVEDGLQDRGSGGIQDRHFGGLQIGPQHRHDHHDLHTIPMALASIYL